ncbi:MAG: precorrin-6y C5,15-methyltransferase (decarboxylating) subunit CbiE [Eubacteriales bacterium]
MNLVTLVGMGMGNPDTLTVGGLQAIQSAKLLIGAKRILDALPESCDGQREVAIASQDIAAILRKNVHLTPAAVVLSGDTGFYSGAKKLPALLPDFQVKTLPGITTVQYFSAQLQKPWQDVTLASGHGLNTNIFAYILRGKPTFFLTGGTITPQTIATQLTEVGLGDTVMHIGENLSYPEEKITTLPVKEAKNQIYHPLSSVWIEAVARPYEMVSSGIPDEEFIRGEVPMTKQEVRAAAVAKLGACPDDVLYDVGAGTGSVAVELALIDPSVQVYAIECVEKACDLILVNRAKFGAYNLAMVPGKAPEALVNLPKPNGAFIGGSRGNLKEILELLLEKNPKIRVCISAIAAETMAEALTALKSMNFTDLDIAQVSVARGRKAGPYHLMTGQNPIFLLSAKGGGL